MPVLASLRAGFGRLLCALGLHDWRMSSGTCADGWIWATNRCGKCGAFSNPYMESAVRLHDEAGPR